MSARKQFVCVRNANCSVSAVGFTEFFSSYSHHQQAGVENISPKLIFGVWQGSLDDAYRLTRFLSCWHDWSPRKPFSGRNTWANIYETQPPSVWGSFFPADTTAKSAVCNWLRAEIIVIKDSGEWAAPKLASLINLGVSFFHQRVLITSPESATAARKSFVHSGGRINWGLARALAFSRPAGSLSPVSRPKSLSRALLPASGCVLLLLFY